VRIPAPGDLPPGAEWHDGRCDCRTRSEHDRLCFTRDREAIRNSDEHDERIAARVAGALQSPGIKAVVEVVLDETQTLRDERNDSRNAVHRTLDLVNVWESIDPDGIMSRRRAAAIVRQVVQP
jgi:hypothetical protein